MPVDREPTAPAARRTSRPAIPADLPLVDRLTQARRHARAHGGVLVSRTAPRSNADRLTFRCANRHTWSPSWEAVRKGAWCKACRNGEKSRARRRDIADFQQLAMARGGRLVSTAFRGVSHPMEWECQDGHRWFAIPLNVERLGAWCPKCRYSRGERLARHVFETIFRAPFPSTRPEWLRQDRARARPLELDGYCKPLALAFEHQGPHHDRAIPSLGSDPHAVLQQVQARDQYKRDRCAARGVLLVEVPFVATSKVVDATKAAITAAFLLAGRALPSDVMAVPVDISGVLSRRPMVELQAIASAYGGQCLSPQFLGAREALRWRCAAGHEWTATPSNVRDGTWCHLCRVRAASARRRTRTVADLQAHAAQKGGMCLAAEYTGLTTAVPWRCAAGHEWTASSSKVLLAGRWCPVCAGNVRNTLDGLHRAAAEQGGACLATTYSSNKDRVGWQCAAGHTFTKRVLDVLVKRQWCPACGDERTAASNADRLARAHAHAVSYGGTCLSSAPIPSLGRVRFQCAAGHVWETDFRTGVVRNGGSWCRACGTRRRAASA